MSKRFKEIEKLVDRTKLYSLTDALALAKKTAGTKFVETIDLAFKLNYKPKKGETIRSTVSLPHGSGKSVRVAVIASAGKVKDAEDAGADTVGSDELIEKIKEGFLGFDILLATPDMMPKIAKLGKLLGTKGLMPNPKSGTVTPDIGPAVKQFKAGRFEFRMDDGGVIHLIMGKVNFEDNKLADNFKAALEAVRKVKPSSVKGAFIKSVTVSSSMGPGIKIDPRTIEG